MSRYRDKNLELLENEINAQREQKDSLALFYYTEQKKLKSSIYLATINFAKNNSDIELSPYLLITETPNAAIKYLDTVYNGLTPRIKNSKYGKELEQLIKKRKNVAQ